MSANANFKFILIEYKCKLLTLNIKSFNKQSKDMSERKEIRRVSVDCMRYLSFLKYPILETEPINNSQNVLMFAGCMG